MSYVNNCILSFSIIEVEHIRIKQVNQFFRQRSVKPFISVDNDNLPLGWYGGDKYLETPLYIASFNYLEEERFVEHLKTIKWRDPKCVQLIIKRQDEDSFSIVGIV